MPNILQKSKGNYPRIDSLRPTNVSVLEKLLLPLAFSMACVILYPSVADAGKAARCGAQNECLCIDWSFEAGSYIEVRCPGGGNTDGWISGQAGPNNPPTWDGDPDDLTNTRGSWDPNIDEIEFPPGRGSAPRERMKDTLNAGKRIALERLEQDAECKALFQGNPTGHSGIDTFRMISWRDGNGMYPSSQDPCDQGLVFAWVDASSEKAEAYLCYEFQFLKKDLAAAVLIHEALHIAGQDEDQTSWSGPGDPPRSMDISQIVANACNLPEVFY